MRQKVAREVNTEPAAVLARHVALPAYASVSWRTLRSCLQRHARCCRGARAHPGLRPPRACAGGWVSASGAACDRATCQVRKDAPCLRFGWRTEGAPCRVACVAAARSRALWHHRGTGSGAAARHGLRTNGSAGRKKTCELVCLSRHCQQCGRRSGRAHVLLLEECRNCRHVRHARCEPVRCWRLPCQTTCQARKLSRGSCASLVKRQQTATRPVQVLQSAMMRHCQGRTEPPSAWCTAAVCCSTAHASTRERPAWCCS